MGMLLETHRSSVLWQAPHGPAYASAVVGTLISCELLTAGAMLPRGAAVIMVLLPLISQFLQSLLIDRGS